MLPSAEERITYLNVLLLELSDTFVELDTLPMLVDIICKSLASVIVSVGDTSLNAITLPDASNSYISIYLFDVRSKPTILAFDV